MIINVNQIRANGKNEFEIKVNGESKYQAKTPFFKTGIPFGIDNLRSLELIGLNGEVLYTTEYSVKDNLKESINPLKFLTKDGQKFCEMSIVDNDGCKCGSVYSKLDGLWKEKYCLGINNEILFGYSVDKGNIRAISFYKDDKQIAQITKPFYRVNRLDTYYIHLLDEYTYMAELLSFFVIYLDYCEYGSGNELYYNGMEISKEYSYNKNNKFYNKNWIKNQFGEEEDIRFKTLINTKRHEIKDEMKCKVKKILLLIGSMWLVIVIIALVLFLKLK